MTLMRLLLRQQQQYNNVLVTRAVSRVRPSRLMSTSSSVLFGNAYFSSQQQHGENVNYPKFWQAAAATFAAGAGILTATTTSLFNCTPVALCEEEMKSTKQQEQQQGEDIEAKDDDPYENLPEEDEETDCSMCKTFRQGPCRPYWRKLERCFKDHEEEENGAVKCMKYFTPHQQCLSQYTNLYQLVSLQFKQELVRDAELSVSDPKERRTWKKKSDIEIDWGKWPEFVNEMGLSFKQTIHSTNEEEELPLWKRFPNDLEPVLITATSKLSRTVLRDAKRKDDMILKVAWAVDQEGMVLGLSYNQQYGDLLAKSTPKKDGDEEKKEEQEKDETPKFDPNSPFELEFFILPGETQKVKICAMYAENPLHADPDKEILDVLLFHSVDYSVKEGAVPAVNEEPTKRKKKKKTAKKTSPSTDEVPVS